MSRTKINRVVAMLVFCSAILVFSHPSSVVSNSRSTSNALKSSAALDHTLSTEGTAPPPVTKPIKPSTLG
jgi:hypothetical protein